MSFHEAGMDDVVLCSLTDRHQLGEADDPKMTLEGPLAINDPSQSSTCSSEFFRAQKRALN